MRVVVAVVVAEVSDDVRISRRTDERRSCRPWVRGRLVGWDYETASRRSRARYDMLRAIVSSAKTP
jgi:hypothetical protein